MNSISAWTINVQSELELIAPIFETNYLEYAIEVKCTDNSLWVIANWPKVGRIAFRAAYAITAIFTVDGLKEKDGKLETSLSTALGTYKVMLDFQIPKILYCTILQSLRHTNHCLFRFGHVI